MIKFTPRPDNLHPAENPADRWLEGWVGPLTCPDVAEDKILLSLPEFEPVTVQSVT